jgi:hypothetical protein
MKLTLKKRIKGLIFALIDRCEFLVKPLRRILFRIMLIDEVALRGLTPSGSFEIPGGEVALRLMDRMTLLETRLLWATLAVPQHSGTLRAQSLALLADPHSVNAQLRILADQEYSNSEHHAHAFLAWMDAAIHRGGQQRLVVLASYALVKGLQKSEEVQSKLAKLNELASCIVWIEPANDLYGPLYFGFGPPGELQSSGSARTQFFRPVRSDVLTALLAEQGCSDRQATHVWLGDYLFWNHPLVSCMIANQALRLAGGIVSAVSTVVPSLSTSPSMASSFRMPGLPQESRVIELLAAGGKIRISSTDGVHQLRSGDGDQSPRA